MKLAELVAPPNYKDKDSRMIRDQRRMVRMLMKSAWINMKDRAEETSHPTMIKCIVEMFGVPRDVTGLREVEVSLEENASLSNLVDALRRAIPALDGRVIQAGADRLLDNYGFNIKGQFYFDNAEVQLEDGEHIIIITIATGG